jgi:hypothetical protein
MSTEEVAMRRSVGLVVAVMGIALGGCSSGDSFAVELSHGQEHIPDKPFQATGGGVDEGALCSSGTMNEVRLESIDGDAIVEEDWADMFDSAMDTGGVAEMTVSQEWTCDDGSGTFSIKFHNKFDFAIFEFQGQQDVGSWEIDQGTGSYSDLTGSGDVTLDWDAEKAIYSGEIQTG